MHIYHEIENKTIYELSLGIHKRTAILYIIIVMCICIYRVNFASMHRPKMHRFVKYQHIGYFLPVVVRTFFVCLREANDSCK